MRPWGIRSAAVGGALGLATGVVWGDELLGLRMIDALLLFAPLVLVPLGLSLRQAGAGVEPRLHRWARVAQPWAAALAAASFFASTGVVAALLASGWLVVSGLLALCALSSLPTRGLLRPDALCLDAALVCLPVGAGWLVASRLGATPMGFGEPIVILTAVHFHYAGFTTMLLVGLAGRALQPLTPALLRPVAWGAMLGPPLLAAGITLSPRLEAVAAAVVVATLLGLSLLVAIVLRPRMAPGWSRWLLTISAASPLVSMTWAASYALLELQGRQTIGVLEMARIHGVFNAFGFGLCGLLAFFMARPSAPRASWAAD